MRIWYVLLIACITSYVYSAQPSTEIAPTLSWAQEHPKAAHLLLPAGIGALVSSITAVGMIIFAKHFQQSAITLFILGAIVFGSATGIIINTAYQFPGAITKGITVAGLSTKLLEDFAELPVEAPTPTEEHKQQEDSQPQLTGMRGFFTRTANMGRRIVKFAHFLIDVRHATS